GSDPPQIPPLSLHDALPISATQPIASVPTAVRAVGGEPLRPGATFAGRYEVKEIVGAGGMGVVYRAFDRELQEPVAIKTLRPEADRKSTRLNSSHDQISYAV